MLKILVTGANGQLGNCIQEISRSHTDRIQFDFKSSVNLNITDRTSIFNEMEAGQYQYCINCAGYTNVDGAETNQRLAERVNAEAVKFLSEACETYNTTLIHISTDFVFNGSQSTPYTEKDNPKADSVYGNTKLQGEKYIQEICTKYFIIRTSWLYAEHSYNFLRSMLRHGRERDQLSVVFDQIGTPTYARDLAEVLLLLITREIQEYGIYHFSNEGIASWYDFAKAIFEMNKIEVRLQPVRTSEYPLPAQRPSYSVLDKSKIKEILNIEIPHWTNSLKVACGRLQEEIEIVKK
ncbi:dTDP-4-dehydrorhamnose reductase [Spongiimicrobium salis]|uniref:dTDP-4-dehydrorhamnose reductase n=1 Tax=Spongiimicrobium salis TaxID=1667022 RepID=UPI00374D7CFE